MEATTYRIRVRGRLTERLGTAFGPEVTAEPGASETALVSTIRDQAQLFGVIDRIRDLGLELISVEPQGTE